MNTSKVAYIRLSGHLNDKAIYAIAYVENGVQVGGSFARGDEIDEWRSDLKAAGWTLNETEGADQ